MSQTPAETPRTAAGFAEYVEAMEAAGAPLLGHLVMYSIYSGEVTPDQCQAWFRELKLDEALCPGGIEVSGVYERITGPSGIRRTYDIASGKRDEADPRALLMIRHVGRDERRIVRHLVREVRDEKQVRLSYDARLAVITFVRDQAQGASATDGTLAIERDEAAIGALPQNEQLYVAEVLDEVREAFGRGRLYLSADKLRAVVRDYIESFAPIKVRPSGGVYFVGAKHSEVLGRLQELVCRFNGPGRGEAGISEARSNLARIPVAGMDEMREMVITAFIAQAWSELQKLSAEISAAQADAKVSKAAVQRLYDRFAELRKAAAEHEAVLKGSIGDTESAMELAQVQLASLLVRAG